MHGIQQYTLTTFQRQYNYEITYKYVIKVGQMHS